MLFNRALTIKLQITSQKNREAEHAENFSPLQTVPKIQPQNFTEHREWCK